MGANLRHRHAFGKAADLRQHYSLACCHGCLQAVGILGLDADHLDLGAQVLDVGGDASDQPAAAHRHEDRIQCAGLLAQDLHGHRTLTGNHVRVVERWDEGRAFTVGKFQSMGQRMRKTVAVQHHLTTARSHAVHFQFRGGGWHHDGCAHAQLTGSEGYALSVIAG
ncbi:hypothetical protein D3C78_1450250 [compost metagenome]